MNPFTGMVMNNMAGVPQAAGPPTNPSAAAASNLPFNGTAIKFVGNDVKIVNPGDAAGPTHVMVDGSLIPISTNPQTIVPAPLPLATAQGQSGIPLGGAPSQAGLPLGNAAVQKSVINSSSILQVRRCLVKCRMVLPAH